MKYVYLPDQVCSSKMTFEINDGKIYNCTFEDGCESNLMTIGMLIEGMEAQKVVDMLAGIECESSNYTTSCADQLSKGIEFALKGDLEPVKEEEE